MTVATLQAVPAIQTGRILEVFRSRQGEGLCVGDEQIFVRFGGCNLVCDYCDTPESIPVRSGIEAERNDVLSLVQKLDGGACLPVTLTGGEPLLQVRFLKTMIPALRRLGHAIYLETNGALPQALAEVVDGCDWIAMDLKPPSAVRRDLWEAHQWFLETGAKKIFVKMVLTARTTDAEVKRAVDLISGVRPQTPLVLQPATPVPRVPSVPLPRLLSWWEWARQRLPDVRVLPQIHPLWGIR